MAAVTTIRLRLLMWVVVCGCNLIIHATARSIPNEQALDNVKKSPIALYVFGDSFYDAGNNNYLKPASGYGNVFPYGRTFFNYSSGRFTDGRNIVDYIAAYLNLPLIQPYLLPGYQRYADGVNFASAGAGALDETNQGLVINLNTQLQHFKEVKTKLQQDIGDAKTESLLKKALFMFSIGTVDYQNHFVSDNMPISSPYEEYVNMVIGNISSAIYEVYNAGGRRFGILNLLRMGCTPLLRSIVLNQTNTQDGCSPEANDIANLHNTRLSNQLQKLHTQLRGFEYSIFDLYSTLWERMQNPSKYGFKEGDTLACCGSGPFRGKLNCGMSEFEACEDPDNYVHFDSVHPTEKTYGQLAELMWSGDSDVASPHNLKTMLKL